MVTSVVAQNSDLETVLEECVKRATKSTEATSIR